MENINFKDREFIKQQTISDFSFYIGIIQNDIDILFEILDNLTDQNRSINLRNKVDINRNIIIRLLPLLISCTHTCENLIFDGEYILAQHIFRLIMEIIIKIEFFLNFPDKAYKIFVGNKGNDGIKINQMLEELDYPFKSSFKKIYGHLSNSYSHVNLKFPDDLFLIDKVNSTQFIAIGWAYKRGIAEEILYFLSSVISRTILVIHKQDGITSFSDELEQKIYALIANYEELTNNPPI